MKRLSRREFTVSIIGTAAAGVQVAATSRQASAPRGSLAPDALAQAFERATEWHARKPPLGPDTPVPPLATTDEGRE